MNNVVRIEKCNMLLIVLKHAAIQVVCFHYMLTHIPWNVCGMLNIYTFILIKNRMNDQWTSYDAKNKHSSVQWIHI